MKKKVYIAFAADILHKGHINILNKASKLGEIRIIDKDVLGKDEMLFFVDN